MKLILISTSFYFTGKFLIFFSNSNIFKITGTFGKLEFQHLDSLRWIIRKCCCMITTSISMRRFSWLELISLLTSLPKWPMYKQTNKQTDKQTNKQCKQCKQTKQFTINPWFDTMIYFWESHSENRPIFKITEGMNWRFCKKNKLVALHFFWSIFQLQNLWGFLVIFDDLDA